jgi:hypothetical protein
MLLSALLVLRPSMRHMGWPNWLVWTAAARAYSWPDRSCAVLFWHLCQAVLQGALLQTNQGLCHVQALGLQLPSARCSSQLCEYTHQSRLALAEACAFLSR